VVAIFGNQIFVFAHNFTSFSCCLLGVVFKIPLLV